MTQYFEPTRIVGVGGAMENLASIAMHRGPRSFEESDGMTVIGHTPEKDAFIGLILAIDMVQIGRASCRERV